MPMPNRQMIGGELYRYGYQGEFAETDTETGKPAFQLRIYDPRIGRWTSPDPYGQYFSPYLAMGNRPNMLVDPDGGCVDENGNPCTTPGKIGGTALDGGGNQWSWDGETWNTDFSFGLNEVMISGHGSGLSGIAGVRFEQWKQIIEPDITQRKENWKGAYGIALSPLALIGALELAPVIVSNIPTFSSTTAVFSGEATVAGTESLYTYQTILRAGKASQGIFRVGQTAIVHGQIAAAPITYIAGRGSLPILADVYSRGAPFFQTHGTAFIKYLSAGVAGGYLAWKSFIEPNNKNNSNNPEKTSK